LDLIFYIYALLLASLACMSYEQPSVYLYSIRIDEPVTVATDLLVSVVCFYAFFNLSRLDANNHRHKFMLLYFLSMGISFAIGGVIGHGFIYALPYEWKLAGWLPSMISVFFIERASIEYSKQIIPRFYGKLFSWLNIIELLVFMVITLVTLNFFFVEVHSAYGLLVVVAGFHAYIYWKTKNKGSKLFLIAVAISAISALVYMNEWGISKWFTHYDISHTIMAFSAFVFYKGGRAIVLIPLQYESK
jgi:hypothetical protein